MDLYDAPRLSVLGMASNFQLQILVFFLGILITENEEDVLNNLIKLFF